jgi:hypothetical protein
LRDLVYSRLLPMRQTVGQFLARYEPRILAEGLRSVTVQHAPEYAAEARVTLGWLRRRLACCGPEAATAVYETKPATAGSLGIVFEYQDAKKYFRWNGDAKAKHALFEADFGTGVARLPAAMSFLTPEMALSEAMFF